MKLKTRSKRRFRRFNQRVASLDIRKLFALTLIFVALDTGTALLNYTLAPETFAKFEQNSLFRWALVTGHVEGYLVAESIKIMAAVTVFALASWITVFRLSMLIFPMITLYAASTNITAIMISPASVTFVIVQFAAMGLISAVFIINRERWFKK